MSVKKLEKRFADKSFCVTNHSSPEASADLPEQTSDLAKKENITMKTIDLTTPESALAYLRSLPADQEISLPGHHTESTTEGDAVRAITEESAHTWAGNRRQWEWTAGELVSALEDEKAGR